MELVDVRLVLLGVGSVAILYAVSLAIVDVLQGDAAEPSQTAQVALSTFWGIVALVAIVVGLVGDVRELRYGGLALLGLSVAKVFAYDLSELDSLYRVLSFIAVGIVLLVGAYAYQRVEPPGRPHVNVGAVVAAFVAVGLVSEVEASEFRYTRPLAAPPARPSGSSPTARCTGTPPMDSVTYGSSTPRGRRFPGARSRPVAVPAREVALVARGELDGVVSVVLDRGVTADVIDRIELEVPDREFVGEVEVLGSTTGAEGSYATLSTTQIYAVSGAVAARSTTGALPADGLPLPPRACERHLRDRRRDRRARSAAAPTRSDRRELERPSAVACDRRDARSRVRRTSLSTRSRCSPARTRSSVRSSVEGSNDGTTFVSLGGGEVARFRGRRPRPDPVDGRHRYVRVTIQNGDDAPLSAFACRRWHASVRSSSPKASSRRIGSSTARRPSPRRRTTSRGCPRRRSAWTRAVAGSLGPESVNADFEPPADTRTFFEKHSSLVNGLLVVAAVVVAVGGLLALRRRA